MTRSLNFGNHLQVPHLLFFSQIPPLHLQRLLQLRIFILFSTLPHHFCCLPPSPPSGQSLKQDWQSLQCFLLPYNSSVLVPILVALGPHWVPISLSGSLSIKISIHSLCSSICFLLSKNGICSRPRLMTILFHFLPSFFTLTIGKTVLETWHLRHWLQFWQLRTWIQTIILTWQLIVTLDSIRNSCNVSIVYHEKNLVEGFLQVNLVHRELQTLKSIMTILDSKCSRLKALPRNSYLSQVMLRWSRDACILFPKMFWFGSPSSPKIDKYIQESFENG